MVVGVGEVVDMGGMLEVSRVDPELFSVVVFLVSGPGDLSLMPLSWLILLPSFLKKDSLDGGVGSLFPGKLSVDGSEDPFLTSLSVDLFSVMLETELMELDRMGL